MPATVGRIRMPADNRLSVSDSLKSSEIWQKSVGYDPYAPKGETTQEIARSSAEDKARGMYTLARLTGNTASITPGACRKCGQVGHLTFQCRNHIMLLEAQRGLQKPTYETHESNSSNNNTEEPMNFKKQEKAMVDEEKKKHGRKKEFRHNNNHHHHHHRHRRTSSSPSSRSSSSSSSVSSSSRSKRLRREHHHHRSSNRKRHYH